MLKTELIEAFEVPSSTYQLVACIEYIREQYKNAENKSEFTIELRDLLIDNLK